MTERLTHTHSTGIRSSRVRLRQERFLCYLNEFCERVTSAVVTNSQKMNKGGARPRPKQVSEACMSPGPEGGSRTRRQLCKGSAVSSGFFSFLFFFVGFFFFCSAQLALLLVPITTSYLFIDSAGSRTRV